MKDGKEALSSMTPVQILAMSALGQAPAILTPMLRMQGIVRPPYNLIISNVPGPRTTHYWNGAQLIGTYPLSIPINGMALNITCTSYDGKMAFGLTGCRRTVPHLQRLLTYLDDELAALEKPPGSAGRLTAGASARAGCARRRPPRRPRDPTPSDAERVRHLVQRDEPDHQRERRLQRHQRPERAGGQAAQRQQLERERHDGQQDRQPEADQQQLGGQVADDARPGDHRRRQRRDRHRDRQPGDPADLVADALGEQDVRRPAAAAPSAKATPTGSAVAGPRLGQAEHADRRRAAPTARPAPRLRDHGDAERPEELQRARRAQRQPGDRRHEQHGEAGGDDAERDAVLAAPRG